MRRQPPHRQGINEHGRDMARSLQTTKMERIASVLLLQSFPSHIFAGVLANPLAAGINSAFDEKSDPVYHGLDIIQFMSL